MRLQASTTESMQEGNDCVVVRSGAAPGGARRCKQVHAFGLPVPSAPRAAGVRVGKAKAKGQDDPKTAQTAGQNPAGSGPWHEPVPPPGPLYSQVAQTTSLRPQHREHQLQQAVKKLWLRRTCCYFSQTALKSNQKSLSSFFCSCVWAATCSQAPHRASTALARCLPLASHPLRLPLAISALAAFIKTATSSHVACAVGMPCNAAAVAVASASAAAACAATVASASTS